MLIPGRPTLNKQELAWNSLTSWLDEWYARPDTEGLKISLCALTAHYYNNERPLWLLAIGDAGSGKTEILIRSFLKFPDARMIGSLTPKCFLSSFKRGKTDTQDHSMLNAGGPRQIWLAQDFTDFAAMRFEDRAQTAAKLRQIWDGQLVSDTGVGGTQQWKGKVTLLAVATPGFERHWAALSDLGERFMTLRWRQGDRRQAMSKVRLQSGKEEEIRGRAQDIMLQVLEGRGNQASMPMDSLMHKRDAIAEVVCQLRRHVERDGYGRRDVLEVSDAEFPSRVSFALSQVVRTHMDLFHRDKPGPEEFQLAERLAYDTIPIAVRKILECIPTTEGIAYSSIARRVKLPDSTMRRRLEDLVLFDVIKPYSGKWGDRIAEFTPDFAEILAVSGLKFHGRAELIEMPKLVRHGSHRLDLSQYPDD